MKNLMLCLATVSLLCLGPSLYAGQKKVTEKTAANVITGCLTKGEAANSFMLTEKGGEKVTVTGLADLSKHANHTVTLTGTMSKQGGKEVFKATKIDHVAAACTG